MSEPSIATMLENCRTAINTCLANGGVIEHQINGRRQVVGLTELREYEQHLMARQSAEQGGSRNYAGFARPS